MLIGQPVQSVLEAQPAGYNYDEAKVPAYTLPDVLTAADGKKVRDAKTWLEKRRPELLETFSQEMFGRSPARPARMSFKVASVDKNALGGQATRKQIFIYPNGEETGPRWDLLIYQPNSARQPAPVFLGLNFDGNHSIHTDPGILLPQSWVRDDKERGVTNNRATDAGRGKSTGRWPAELVVSRGYALATMYYGDIDPDFHDGFTNGIHALYPPKNGKRTVEDWGSIAAWAWGLSRIMDYIETDRELDSRHVALLGHSRLGKAALWGGATDQRFAIVISNNSGCGGAALSRRVFGETVQRINTSFPHWFADNYKKYNNNENAASFDQHELLALIAPRPLYVASAEEDLWADPRGEFLAAKFASPVYELYDLKGVASADMPAVNHPVGGHIGYHVRTGKHDVTNYDWEQYLNFADRHFGRANR